MKKITLLFLLLSAAVYSQDFSTVDATVASYPHSITDVNQLAQLIKKDFTSENDKARAIYSWIAQNVQFDDVQSGKAAFTYKTEQERVQKEKKYKAEIIAKALKDNKATSRGYTELFEKLCNEVGIECVSIVGFLKASPQDIGKSPVTVNHSWNAVKIKGEWRFADATLGAGIMVGPGQFRANFNDGYFFTAPDKFFLNHYPNDEKWLLTKKTKEEFINLPLYYGEYIKADYTIIEPSAAVVTIPSDGEIVIKFKDANPYMAVYYFTDGANKLEYLEIDANTMTAKAKVNKETDHYLNIVIDQQFVVTYILK